MEVFLSNNYQGGPYDARNPLRKGGVSVSGCPRYDLGAKEELCETYLEDGWRGNKW